jgi:hypothetical protein
MARMPELMQMAYGMYRDKLNNNAQNLGMLQDLENTSYGRSRDAVSDWRDQRDFGYNSFINDRDFNRNNFESDRAYDRGVMESDRAYGRNVLESDRNYDRSNLESDRNFDRGVLESDRNFDRGVLESDRNFDRGVLESDRNFDYQVSRDQVMDEQWLKQFTADEQQRIVSNALQSRQISNSEANTLLNREQFDWEKNPENPDYQYKQTQAKKATKDLEKADPENTIGALYQGMMQAQDPSQWLIENADWLTNDELKALAGYIPNQSDDLQRLILQSMQGK